MISNVDEKLHDFKKASDWKETFSFNFTDKKNKTFGYIDIAYFPKKNKIRYSYSLLVSGHEYNLTEEKDAPASLNGTKFSHPNLKYSIAQKDYEKFELNIKDQAFELSLDVKAFHHIYDYPFAVETEVDDLREKYEALLWNRFEQRCRFRGKLKFKTGEKKNTEVDINCYGQRDRQWGSRQWNELNAYSLYYIQFRDYAFSLTYYDFGEVKLSNGFISKKSGNIPIYETELEHIDINPKDKLAEVSEIFYKDSQDDSDLIVSKRIHSFDMQKFKYGKNNFHCFLNVSDFTIIGAQKRGVGFEKHFIRDEYFNEYTSDK